MWSTLGRGRQGTFWRGRQAVRAQPGGLGSWHPVGDMPGTRALVCWSRETRFVLRCVCVRGQTADSELGDNLRYSQFSHFSFAPHRRRRVHPACEDTPHTPSPHNMTHVTSSHRSHARRGLWRGVSRPALTPVHAAHTPQPASSQSPRPRPSPSAPCPPRAVVVETREPRGAARGFIVYLPCRRLSGVCADPSQNKWVLQWVCRSTVSTVTH